MLAIVEITDINRRYRCLERLSKPLQAHQSYGKLKKLVLKSSYTARLRTEEENLEAALASLTVSNQLIIVVVFVSY